MFRDEMPNKPKLPKRMTPQVGDTPSGLQLNKPDKACKPDKAFPKTSDVGLPSEPLPRPPPTDDLSLFSSPAPDLPAHLSNDPTRVCDGEPEPLPLPSDRFAAYLRTKMLEAQQSLSASCEVVAEKQFVPLTSVPVLKNDVDDTGSAVGTLVLLNTLRNSIRLLPVHQCNRHLAVVASASTLTELGLPTKAPGEVTSIADRIALLQPAHLQMNLMLFKPSALPFLDGVHLPCNVIGPGDFISVPAGSQVSASQTAFHEEIEVFGFFP